MKGASGPSFARSPSGLRWRGGGGRGEAQTGGGRQGLERELGSGGGSEAASLAAVGSKQEGRRNRIRQEAKGNHQGAEQHVYRFDTTAVPTLWGQQGASSPIRGTIDSFPVIQQSKHVKQLYVSFNWNGGYSELKLKHVQYSFHSFLIFTHACSCAQYKKMLELFSSSIISLHNSLSAHI